MKQLKDILKIFSNNRIKYLNSHTWTTMSEDDRVNAVKEWAEPVAKKIINEGYFRIGNHYCIRVDILELYYNEEAEGGLKDPIMYHTNDRIPKHLKDAGIYDLPYFDIGSFNLHTSGVDITFEDPKEHYRASFLIRGFSVFRFNGNEVIFLNENNDCSTKIYDFFFPNGTSAEALQDIHWESHVWKSSFSKPTGRKNVLQYAKDSATGKYIPNDTGESFKKKEEKPNKCTRPWQFKRK